MKRALMVGLLALAAGSVAWAGDWSGTPLGGNDLLGVRFGYTPDSAPRITVGPEAYWLDDEKAGAGCEIGFFGLYNLVRDAEFDLLGVQAPVSWYVGVAGGMFLQEAEHPNPTAGLMTGLRFGDGQLQEGQKVTASLGIEIQYPLRPSLWKELADFSDEVVPVVFAEIRWK